MAARRLIAVLVVLLVVSSIAAALAPEARRPETTSTEPTAPNSQPGPDTEDPDEPKPVPEEELPTGKLVERTVAVSTGTASAQQESKEAKPPPIEVTVGDRLALEVTSADTAAIEIPDFGLIETASAGSPARFDMLMREAGTFTIRVIDGPAVAEIVVSEPVAATSKPGAGKPAPDQGGDGQQQPQQSGIEPAPETAA